MNYLTTTELSQKWNISSRMIAYHCASNRISGAIKKGKSWLIPAGAVKPMDGRTSKNKISLSNSDYSSTLDSIDAVDFANANKTYNTSELYKNLGLTRELIRYYEELGIITPNRNINSNYREFDWVNIIQLMGVDFYKKRGFISSEIANLMTNQTRQDLLQSLTAKETELQDTIKTYTTMLENLTESKKFYEQTLNSFGEFKIKELPIYEVVELFDYATSLSKYETEVLPHLDKNQDIMSSLARVIITDDSKLVDSSMCVVKLASSSNPNKNTKFLESGKCVYTAITSDNTNENLSETILKHCKVWAKSKGYKLKGMAYIFLKFVELSETNIQFHEIFIPIE